MKNIKKLVSSVLALPFLAGSAVSMSCSAGSAQRGKKQLRAGIVEHGIGLLAMIVKRKKLMQKQWQENQAQ